MSKVAYRKTQSKDATNTTDTKLRFILNLLLCGLHHINLNYNVSHIKKCSRNILLNEPLSKDKSDNKLKEKVICYRAKKRIFVFILIKQQSVLDSAELFTQVRIARLRINSESNRSCIITT